MSIFNEDCICMDCKYCKETKDKDYEKARDRELE